MLRILTLLFALCFALPATAQQFPGIFQVAGVASNDVLNIRSEPSARSEIVGALRYNQRGVEVIGLSEDRNWGLVQNGEGVGWISMRFTARQIESTWHQGEIGLTCGGTEPFWTFNFFLPNNRAEFHSPETSYEVRTTAPYLPTTYHPLTMAMPFNGARDGVAIVRQGVCSDGMSDRVYGLEMQVYIEGEAIGFSGCCNLAP